MREDDESTSSNKMQKKETRPPWDVYKGIISKEQWNVFKATYETPEFQVHPHGLANITLTS